MHQSLHKIWSIVVAAGLLAPAGGEVASHASTGAVAPGVSAIEVVPAAPQPPRRITIPPDSTSVTFSTSLVPGVSQSYVLRILAGQQLIVASDNDVSTLNVLSPGGGALAPTYEQPGNWEFSAPATGDYTLVFAGQGPITPTITVSPGVAPLPAGVPASISLPATRQRIIIAPGSASSTVTAELTSQAPQAYVVRGAVGQQMILNASGDVSLQVYDAQGNRLTGVMVQPGPWPVTLPEDGDYTIALMGGGPARLTVSLPPLAPATAPAPQRIAFAPGATSVTAKADLSQGVWQAYVLHVAVGQTMFITIQANTIQDNATQSAASLDVRDPGGSSLSPLSTTAGQWQFGLPEVGDYTLLLQGQGPVTLTVTIPPLSTTRNVTVADKDQTLTFQVGQSFLLFLGNDFTWTATTDDPAVVSHMPPDLFAVPGAQGLFEARKPGHTTLTAIGEPACRQEQIPCAVPTPMVFSVQIVVQ